MKRRALGLCVMGLLALSALLGARPSAAFVTPRHELRRPPRLLLIGRWMLIDDVVDGNTEPPLHGEIYYVFDAKSFERIEQSEHVLMDLAVLREEGSDTAFLELDEFSPDQPDAVVSFPDPSTMLFRFLPPDTFAPHHMRFHRVSN